MKTCGFSEFYSEADVHRAIGIIRTNCIHVQPQYLKNQVLKIGIWEIPPAGGLIM